MNEYDFKNLTNNNSYILGLLLINYESLDINNNSYHFILKNILLNTNVIALIQKIGNDTSYAFNYAYEFFSSRDNKTISCIHNLVRGLIIPFVRDYKEYVASNSKIEPELKTHDANAVAQSNRKIFVLSF